MSNKKLNPVSWKHFKPYSIWEVEQDGSVYTNSEPKYIKDTSTSERYLNESSSVIRFKCALLVLGTPIVHTIASILHIAYNLAKLFSFYHFWKSQDEKQEKTDYNLNERAHDLGMDVFHIFFAPLNVLYLTLSALYGIFRPHDGRKLYASGERFAYGQPILAPCFQPEPEAHLFGSDINSQNGL